MLLSGNAAASVLLLARNLIVARLIPVEDYGIAATFAVTMALVEMSTQFGLQQQIIQSKDGEDIRFQSALQGFQVIRGVFAGAMLFALAGPIAAFLRIPDVAWAYQVMATLPVLRSFQHFDIHRLNRALRYGPLLLTGVIPAIVSLAIVWPLALWLGDYRVMLFALVVHEALGAVTSHLVAERPYRLVFDRAIMAGSLRFGWPLLLNGMLLFLVMQGDKLIVGRELGMVALGIFGMGITLTLTPTLILAKSTQNFFLPQLSAAASNTDGPEQTRFEHVARAAFQAALLNGTILILGVFFLGLPLVQILLGDKYAALQPLMIWLAVQQGLRVFKSGPSTAAVARAVTSNAMWPNLLRVAAFPVIWISVQNGGGLGDVIVIALIAEALGYAFALVLAQVRLGVVLRPLVPSLLVTSTVIAAAMILPAVGQNGSAMLANLALFMLAPVLLLASMGDLRRYARTTFGPAAQRKASL